MSKSPPTNERETRSRLVAGVNAAAEILVPPGIEQRAEALQLMLVVLVIGAWGPPFAMLFVLFGNPALASAIWLGSVLFLATPVVLSATGDTRVAGLWATFQFYWVIMCGAWFTGGMASPSLYYLASLPLFGVATYGRRLAPGMAVLAVASVAGLFAFDQAGLIPDSVVAPALRTVFHAMAAATLIAVVFSLALFQQRQAEDALDEAAASNEELELAAERDRLAHAEVEELGRRLVAQARVVGRAEIAKNVLHSVGNALNHVNMLATQAMQGATRLRVHRLAQSIALLDDHREDLARWLAEDEQGMLLRDYLAQLSTRLGDERDELVRALQDLHAGLEELRTVVSTQDVEARRALLPELVNVDVVIEHAIRVSGFDASGVSVERDIRRMRPVLIDRQRLLEILVHLLTNAKNAVLESPASPKRVQVVATSQPGGRVRIDVADNGVGIAPEDLDRVFQHGFTSRPDGLGFGLHACALSAREMGGKLDARSHGLGRGATFILDLPQYSPTPVPPNGGRGNAPTTTPAPGREHS